MVGEVATARTSRLGMAKAERGVVVVEESMSPMEAIATVALLAVVAGLAGYLRAWRRR